MTDLSTLPGAVYTEWVIPFLSDALACGQRVALVTLVGVTGSSPRPLGSQMAVREDGASIGAISGGCVEQSLVLDALKAIHEGAGRLERYGQGSRFIDIRLPCGSGIDVLTDVGVTPEVVSGLLAARRERRPIAMAIDIGDKHSWLVRKDDAIPASPDGIFIRPYAPPCRITVAGAGQIMVALALLCRLCEIEIDLVCTDQLTRLILQQQGFAINPAVTWQQVEWEALDSWCGVILLSHDHDGEADVLCRVMRRPVFHAGALGSHRTHARRCALLRDMGVAQTDIMRIRGPVGLNLGASTPPEIAVSILAEIIEAWRKRSSDWGAGIQSSGSLITKVTV